MVGFNSYSVLNRHNWWTKIIGVKNHSAVKFTKAASSGVCGRVPVLNVNFFVLPSGVPYISKFSPKLYQEMYHQCYSISVVS